jgi:outer membrane protein assembly factor BamB
VSAEHGNSGLLVADEEMVCSTTVGSRVYCVDAGSGDERFGVQLDRGLATPPVLLDDRLLVASSGAISGDLFAYGLDGEELWTKSLAVDAEGDMPVVGGVLTVVEDQELVGLGIADGKEVWRDYPADAVEARRAEDPAAPDGPHAVGPDVYTDGTLVYAAIETIDPRAGSASGNIVAVDPGSGREVWRSDTLTDIGFGAGIADAAPFEDGDAVAFLMEGTPRRIVVLDAATGRFRWEAPIASDHASIVDAGGATIVADGPDMRALDRDGRPTWEVPSPVIARSPDLTGPGELVVEGGRLFIAGFDVDEVDPTTGASELIRSDVNATDVAVVGDLLVMAGIGELEAVPLPPAPGG